MDEISGERLRCLEHVTRFRPGYAPPVVPISLNESPSTAGPHLNVASTTTIGVATSDRAGAQSFQVLRPRSANANIIAESIISADGEIYTSSDGRSSGVELPYMGQSADGIQLAPVGSSEAFQVIPESPADLW
eukprot:IDg4699t1